MPNKKTDSKTRALSLATYEVNERRIQVQRYRLRGMTYAQIAELLDVSVMTIRRDLEAIREENKEKVDSLQKNEFIGESLSVFDNLQDRAWAEYTAEGTTPQIRLKALDLIRVIQGDKTKVLTDCGLIHKEENNKDKKVEVEHKIALPWDEQTKSDVAKALLETALNTDLEEPEYIEAELEEDDYEEEETTED